jgi:hypothetical protein
MKPIIRKLVIRQTPFPEERKEAILKAHTLEEKYGYVTIQCDFTVIPNFLDDADLETDSDLSEDWVYGKLKNLQYHIVHIDMTKNEWVDLGLRKNLYGQSNIVTTRFGKQAITYGRWDKQIGAEHATHLPQRYQPIHPLTVGIWHEDCHAIADILGNPDTTHLFFYGMVGNDRWKVAPSPEDAWKYLTFKNLDSLENRTRMQILTLGEQVKTLYYTLIAMQQTLLHPIEDYKQYVTQEYGVFDTAYTLTHRHIGCDWATPKGTPVRAPWGGTVTVAGYSSVLGYHCHYQYTYKGQQYTDRYLHLQSQPLTGAYNRGSIIGRTGNSGYSQGYHLHADVWIGDVDLTSINKKNWAEKTRDPQKHYE